MRPRCARQVGERGRGQCSGSRRGEKSVLGGVVKGHGRVPVIPCETLSTRCEDLPAVQKERGSREGSE